MLSIICQQKGNDNYTLTIKQTCEFSVKVYDYKVQQNECEIFMRFCKNFQQFATRHQMITDYLIQKLQHVLMKQYNSVCIAEYNFINVDLPALDLMSKNKHWTTVCEKTEQNNLFMTKKTLQQQREILCEFKVKLKFTIAGQVTKKHNGINKDPTNLCQLYKELIACGSTQKLTTDINTIHNLLTTKMSNKYTANKQLTKLICEFIGF